MKLAPSSTRPKSTFYGAHFLFGGGVGDVFRSNTTSFWYLWGHVTFDEKNAASLDRSHTTILGLEYSVTVGGFIGATSSVRAQRSFGFC